MKKGTVEIDKKEEREERRKRILLVVREWLP